LTVWDLKTRKEVGTFEGHAETITTLAISTDGQTAISGSDDGSLMVTDFTRSMTMASDAQLDADLARVLAATAAPVGIERAVEVAYRNLGPDLLLDAIAYLQAPLLPDRTRKALSANRIRVSTIRDAAAASTGREAPTLAQLERVSRSGLVMALATFVGIYALFGQLGNFTAMGHQLASASWGWFAIALVLTGLTNIGYAMTYVGSTNAHLPFGRTIVLQAAGSFTNVVTPNALGTAAINTRFLQLRGVRLGSAVAAQVVNTIGSGVVQTALFFALIPVASGGFDLSLVPWQSLLTFAVAVVASLTVAAAVAWQIPHARRFVRERIRPALTQVQLVLRSPGKLLLLVAGNLLVQLLYAMSLGAVCRGFGVEIAFSTLLLVNIGSSAISGLVPAPGGLGVAEATLAGALTAAGVPSTIAVAVTLTQRMLTTWLPTIPGWFALRMLERADDL